MMNVRKDRASLLECRGLTELVMARFGIPWATPLVLTDGLFAGGGRLRLEPLPALAGNRPWPPLRDGSA